MLEPLLKAEIMLYYLLDVHKDKLGDLAACW